MILEFLKLSDQERRLYFEESARRRDVSPVIMEKDFWVCWMLGILFESSFAKGLVFKGGTSLSKVFGTIERSVDGFPRSGAQAYVVRWRPLPHGRSS